MISEAAEFGRGSGRTTRQLQRMQDKSLFIAAHLHYTYDLCKKIGGRVNVRTHQWFTDDGAVVKIYGQEILRHGQQERLYGYEFSEIVVDHAIHLDLDQRDGLRRLSYAVRL